MSDKRPDLEIATPSPGGIRWKQEVFICALIAVILGFFVWMSDPNTPLESTGSDVEGSYYNLLVEGFSQGHLYIPRDAPAALARLANPYDPAANAPYLGPVNDLSYYKGRLYVYFGVTPVLVLFWPWHILTGRYLSDGSAVPILFGFGFAVTLGLVRAMQRRYFRGTNALILTGSMVALGLAIALTLSGSIYEVAITCGFLFGMVALLAIWCALHAEPTRKVLWLLLASISYGLAVGSRPSLLFGAIILLAPVVQTWRAVTGRDPRWRALLLLIPAFGPIMLTGLGLMLYNDLRFGNPFEFGWHYQLTESYRATTAGQFSLHYLLYNFRLYFLEFPGWSWRFPFLIDPPLPPMPPGYDTWGVSAGGAILVRYPMLGFILALPLAWKNRPAGAISGLAWFAAAIALLTATVAVTVCLYITAANRYELDFLPGLLLLSIAGFFSAERIALPYTPWRQAVVFGWCLLLAYSILFNFLNNIETRAEVHYLEGNSCFHDNRFNEALLQYQKAEQLWPDSADAHYGLGNTLAREGHLDDAIAEYQKALEFKPDSPEANNNLAFTLLQAGRLDDAIKYFQRASELQKSYQAFYNLAYAYRMKKMALEAETNWQKAIDLQPQFIPAQIDLAWTLATWPDSDARDGARAVALAENLDRSIPNNPKVLRTLAAAYAETGRFREAVATAKRAMAIAQSQSQTALVSHLQTEAALYQTNIPCRSFTN